MASKQHLLLPLFTQFIRDSKSGKRTKANGERLKLQSIQNYENTYMLLQKFSGESFPDLRIREYQRLTKRERKSEAGYWKKFERHFANYLFTERKAHDNYVGSVFKQLKALFNYLNREKFIETGPYYKSFKVLRQDIPVTALTRNDLLKLIYDKEFHNTLPLNLQCTKDMFIFGCTSALRFSDLMHLKPWNVEQVNGDWYLKTISKKTKAEQTIKLPEYAVEIVLKYRSAKARYLFPRIALANFNEHLKLIGEQMGLTQQVNKQRCRHGLVNHEKAANVRFCDLMSSHLMRRTAITNMLTLGMPENLVKHISGHAGDSKSFHRYVAYSQSYVNTELDKVYEKMVVAK